MREIWELSVQKQFPLNTPLVDKLLNYLKGFGYSYRQCKSYSDVSILNLSGSVLPHTDRGLGLIANWLFYQKDLDNFEDHGKSLKTYNDRSILVTKRKNLELSVGDVFIFNGDKEHAWMSNFHCTLIQVTVKKVRL